MLKKKQNRFPVLFLTQGQSQKYPPYKDFRWQKRAEKGATERTIRDLQYLESILKFLNVFMLFRTLSIPAAIKFACAEQLVGINVHTEDLLRKASWVAETKQAGLLIFCWGEDNNNHENIRYLKHHGVDGIICDR